MSSNIDRYGESPERSIYCDDIPQARTPDIFASNLNTLYSQSSQRHGLDNLADADTYHQRRWWLPTWLKMKQPSLPKWLPQRHQYMPIGTDPNDANPNANNENNNEDDNGNDTPPPEKIIDGEWYQAKRPATIITLCAVLLFSLIASACLALVPMMRLVEDAICRKHYGFGFDGNGEYIMPGSNQTGHVDTGRQFIDDLDGRLCKVDTVQAELAWLIGMFSVTSSILGLFAAFPWALLSDRIGRKPVFRIAFIGGALSFGWSAAILAQRNVLSVWWILTAEMFLFVGGSTGVAITMLSSIVADVSPKDKSSAFMGMSIGGVMGGILGPASAAGIMALTNSVWVPIASTFIIFVPVVLGITVLLPETLQVKADQKPVSLVEVPVPGQHQRQPNFWKETIPAHASETISKLRETVAILRRSRGALLLLPSFVFVPAIQGVQGAILAQSVSKRFGWSLAQMGYLFSIRGVVTVIVLSLIPVLSRFLRSNRCGLSEPRKDLVMARTLLVVVVIGNLLVSTGHSVVRLALGTLCSTLAVGFGSVLKSLITHFFLLQYKDMNGEVGSDADSEGEAGEKTGSEHTSRLYTLTGMVETAGSLLGGPVLAWTFSSGLRHGGAWIGMPYFYVCGLCAIALGCLALIQADPVRQDIFSFYRERGGGPHHEAGYDDGIEDGGGLFRLNTAEPIPGTGRIRL